MKTFSIVNETGKEYPDLPYEEIKKSCLGKNYTLSLIFTTLEKIKKLNLIYRDKNTATDILSFPIDEIEGEIYLCLEEAKKEAGKFNRSYENFVGFLFIHGCVHLKGHDHGSTMENMEVKLRKQFQI